MAGINPAELRALKGSYEGGGMVGRVLPKLESVIEWHDRLPADVPYEYAIRAAFGLRPGEGVRWCKFDHLKSHRELMVFATKTGAWRIVYPYPNSLFDAFLLGDREPIEWESNAKSEKLKTQGLARNMARAGLPFTMYDLCGIFMRGTQF